MSQYRSNRRARRTRNQPVLVTPTIDEPTERAIEESLTGISTQTVEPSPITPDPQETHIRRFPKFFSTVGKSEQDNESKEIDIAQARLARATHSKTTVPTSAKVGIKEVPENDDPQNETPKRETKTGRTTATSARPTSTFKTRYFVGMGIYLLAAQFIGSFEKTFIKPDPVLTRFSLFGGPVVISTSTLVFLATLVIILVLLARFDLIPRSLGAASGTSGRGSGQTQARTGLDSSEGARQIPPSMKQGVKGADDELYREYRISQRREKKR